MRLRRFGVLICAAVLSLGTVGAVSAMQPVDDCNPENQVSGQCPEGSDDPSAEPTHDESAEPTHDESAEPTHDESAEPTHDESAEPTHDESAEPTHDESAEPTHDESAEPSAEDSEEPTDEEESSGEVAGLTSNPTLPPTDGIASAGQQGPDTTLALVVLILGSVGLASYALAPKRGRR